MQSLWMVVASFCFACLGVFVKLASDTYSIVEIIFYRYFFSLLLTFILIRMRGISIRTPNWMFQLWRSISGLFASFLLFYALALLPVATAITLSYTSPLFLVLFLRLLGKNKLGLKMFGTLFLGFFGIALLLRPAFHLDQLPGEICGLGSGFMSGLAFYNLKVLGGRGEPEERTVFYLSLVSTIGSALWMLFSEFHPVDLRGGMALLGVALFGTFAQLAMTRSYRTGNTLISASLAYSTVVFSSIFGIVLWGDTLSVSAWSAIALIITSGVLTTWFSRRSQPEN